MLHILPVVTGTLATVVKSSTSENKNEKTFTETFKVLLSVSSGPEGKKTNT